DGAAVAILGREGDDQLAGIRGVVVADDALDASHRFDDLAVAEAQASFCIVLEAEFVVRPGVVTPPAVVVPAVAMVIVILAPDGDRSAGPVAKPAVAGVEFDVG